MLEAIMATIKSLPLWLATVAEILLVAITTMIALSFIWGFWVGVTILRKRASKLHTIEFWPPKMTFKDPEEKRNDAQ